MIPRCIHLIWIGPHEPPWSCIDSWRKDFVEAHPGWEARLWRDADIERFGLENRRAYEQTASLCGKADIARYEIVCRHGGVYIDADSVWLGRSLDSLLDEARETGFFGALEGSPDLVVCGFFGSAAGHAILRAAVDAIPARLLELAGSPPWVLTGPALLGAVIQRLQALSSRPVATLVPFDRLIAASWHGVTAAALPDLVARHRRQSGAISFQLGYSTNELWRSRIDIGSRG